MLITIDPAEARPIYRQIMDEVRRAIVLGIVKSHDGLPSVRQLAGQIKVNPNTVQQAYRELEREDVVYTRRGQGTFVADGAAREEERERLVEGVAARALRDARRHGLSQDELIEAIGEAEGTGL